MKPFKTLFVVSIFTLTVGALTGCESLKDPHKALADLVHPLGGRVMAEGKEVGSHVKADPKTGAAQTGSSSVANPSAPKEVCTKTSVVSSVDIDTLYARAMSRFTFKTVEQRAHMKTQGYMTDDNYMHTAQTGTYYSLAEGVQIKDLPGITTSGWLELTFAKEGKNVLVTTNTCLNDPSPYYRNPRLRFLPPWQNWLPLKYSKLPVAQIACRRGEIK